MVKTGNKGSSGDDRDNGEYCYERLHWQGEGVR